jgi:two-component system chemotaxis response regulator CheY
MSARILVVEDSRSIRRLIRAALEADGYEVMERGDGEAGLAALQEAPPDLVITDVYMPGMDGLSLVRSIRALRPFRFLPILIITTESGDNMKQSGRAAGATGWIVKPFNDERLRQVVAQLIATKDSVA